MLEHAIAAIKEAGFAVYMQSPRDTWLYYTDGTNIGYAQQPRGESLTLSTVHVPNQTTGTGFRVDTAGGNPLSADNLRRAFAFTPAWASDRDRASVVKWRDWDHFANSSAFNREYAQV